MGLDRFSFAGLWELNEDINFTPHRIPDALAKDLPAHQMLIKCWLEFQLLIQYKI